MKCPNCNHENKDDMKFCEQCGKALNGIEVKNTAEEIVEDEVEENDEVDEAEEVVNKKSHKKMWIAIAVVVVLLSGSTGFLVISGVGGQVISNVTAGTFLESDESKEMEVIYQEGLSFMEAEKYNDAIASFSKITKKHYRYSDAKKNVEICSKRYADSITTAVKEYSKDKDYEKAYTELEQANDETLEDNIALQEEMLQVQKDYKAFLLSQVKECKQKKDYAGALAVLADCDESILPADKEVKAETKAVQDEYRKSVLTEAESLLETEGYTSAISCLKDALVILPKDSALKEKISEYAQYQPIALYDLEYFSASSKVPYVKDDDYKINDGTEYLNGLRMSPSSSMLENPWMEYKIDGAYTSLSGTLALDYDCRTSKEKTVINIYGDGLLLYTSPAFTNGVNPEPFNVSIKNVTKLKIECTGGYNYGGGNAHVFFVDTYLNK